MITAYKLITGDDGHSHVLKGTLKENLLTQVVSLKVQESAPGSSLDWHNAPTTQFVINLEGTLEFTNWSGESFILKPGEILIAMDTKGTGHKWRIIDDAPWRRAYVLFTEEVNLHFEEESTANQQQ